MAIDGVSGSGKTFSALRFAFAFGQRVAVLNSESGAIEKYQGLAPDGIPWEFDVGYMPDFAPTSYTAAILQAGKDGYGVLVIDSLSHAWAGVGGALEIKDKKSGSGGGNSFTAWKDVTPMHNRMVEAILHSPCHIITTMRSKQGYVLETNSQGKQVPRKVGMEPIQRAGMEYEFDVYCSIDIDHVLTVTKTRIPEITDQVIVKPSAAFMGPVIDWLNTGSKVDASFFAVTQADLDRYASRVAAEDRKEQAAQPRKSAMELMEEQAAAEKAAAEAAASKANGSGSTSVVETNPTATVTNGNSNSNGDLATADQVKRIGELVVLLGCGEKINAALARRKIGSVRSLAHDDAQAIIDRLEIDAAKLPAAERDAKAVEAAKAAVNQEMPTCGPATAEQVEACKKALAEFAQIDPTGYAATMQKIVAWLSQNGKGKLADLDATQAAQLYDSIRSKSLPTFILHSLEHYKPKN